MNVKIKNKLTVGLTGGILCGKSTALAAWQKAGAYVISCDELVRQISNRPSVQNKIQVSLGVTEPKVLAKKVFANSAARQQLEQILHPLVLQEIARLLHTRKELVRVVEVPLLFEAGWEKYFDLTVVLVTSEKGLLSRAKKRGLSKTDFLKRARAQWPQVQKAARADICILNETTPQDLCNKISALQRALSAIYKVK